MPTFRSDLETITLKCLEKNPDKRYATAQEFADDLRRHLKREPISAKPCGLVRRVVRWYQRNTMAVIYTAGGYATIVGIILLCWDIIGLALISLGAAEASQRLMLELLTLLVLVYPAILLVGVGTLKGHVLALVTGTLVSFGWCILTLCAVFKIELGFLQLECLNTTSDDPFFQFQLSTLLMVLSIIGLFLYLAALFAKFRTALQERALRQPRVR